MAQDSEWQIGKCLAQSHQTLKCPGSSRPLHRSEALPAWRRLLFLQLWSTRLLSDLAAALPTRCRDKLVKNYANMPQCKSCKLWMTKMTKSKRITTDCLQQLLDLFREALVQLTVGMWAVQTGPRQSWAPNEVRFAPFKLLHQIFIESRQTVVQLLSQRRARLLAGTQQVNQDYLWRPIAKPPCCNANGWDLVLEKDGLV